jgi:CHAD domain-containing protein
VPENRSNSTQKSSDVSPARILRRSLRRVLKEQAAARKDLAADPIHDLRVALRRSRSLAEGFAEFDPYAGWRHLTKACKRLQRSMSELRDVHVVLEWVEKLHLDMGAAGVSLCELLRREERRARRKARGALRKFPRKRWKRWRRQLPKRAAGLWYGEPQFAVLALHRLTDVSEMERRRRAGRSRLAAHQVRIALKRFRYTLESFLPAKSEAWAPALRSLQQLLGEVHDLDVLRARITQFLRRHELPESARNEWFAAIDEARAKRIAAYQRKIVTGTRRLRPGTRRLYLWDSWRADLQAMTEVILPDAEVFSPSSARRASHAAAKSSRRSSRPLRPSSTA